MRCLFVIGILSLLLGTTFAFAADIKFPSPIGYVNDFAKVIDSQSQAKLEELAKNLEAKTGAEMAIVTIQSSQPLDPKTYAVKLLEKWKIGKKGKDNGVLVLLSMKEKHVEIEVGYGLEGTLTDQFCGQVLDNYVVPYFKEGKFGEGLLAGAQALSDNLTPSAVGSHPSPSLMERGIKGVRLSLVIGILVIGSLIIAFLTRSIAPVIGGIIGLFVGYLLSGIFGAIVGFIFGIMVSLGGGRSGRGGWFGGGSSGGSGFGGFGGGRSGGGGAGRSW